MRFSLRDLTRPARLFPSHPTHPLLLQLLLPKGDCAIECQNAHKLRKCRRSRRRRAAKKCSQRREQSMKREREREGGKSSAAGAGLHLGRGVGVVSLPSLAARSSRSAAFLFFLRSLSRAYKIHTLHFSTETRRGPRLLLVPAASPFWFSWENLLPNAIYFCVFYCSSTKWPPLPLHSSLSLSP